VTDWKLSEAQEEKASIAFDAMLAARFTSRPTAAYKGLLDGREVVVLGVLMDGYVKPVALAMTDDLFEAIEVERRDGSVRRGV
jgi:hypothetical protein